MSWWKTALIALAVFLLVGLLMNPRGCAGGRTGRPADAPVIELRLARDPLPPPLSEYSFILRAEVADTPEKRQKGLSGRAGLEPGYGMLYVYPEPQAPQFSQAQTAFDTSLAFLDRDGTIMAIKTARARDPQLFMPEKPISFALETRAGWFDDRGARPGDRIIIPPPWGPAPEATQPVLSAAPPASQAQPAPAAEP